MSDDTKTLYVSFGGPVPLYRQLVDQVRRKVLAGQFQPGDEMPSVRDLAKALTINPMTVSKAYGLLEAEGVLVRRRGKSLAVAVGAGIGGSLEKRTEELLPSLDSAARHAVELAVPLAPALDLFKACYTQAQGQ